MKTNKRCPYCGHEVNEALQNGGLITTYQCLNCHYYFEEEIE